MIDKIDPYAKYISSILHRSQCVEKDGIFYKDFLKLKNLDLKKTIIIDNLVLSFIKNLDNGIYIPSYLGSSDDNELEIIKNFLIKIAHVSDVRPYVSKFSGIKTLYETLKINWKKE